LELFGDLPDGIEVRETLDGFTISLIDYAPGELSLSQRAETVLASVTPLLRSYAKSVVVEGPADSVGQNDLNMAIASARAHHVGDELLSQGLEPAWLEVISWGEERPFAVEETATINAWRPCSASRSPTCAAGFMDLVVEVLPQCPETGAMVLSLAHYFA